MNNKALLLLVATATALSYAHAACEAECTTRDPAADFSINYDGRCTESAFLEKVTDAADHACLVCLYNHARGTSLSDINAVVRQLCIDGYAADVFPFSEITKKGQQFDNEHYAGGGQWNYQIETAAGENRLEDDAKRVDDVYYYEAQRKVIEFPDRYLESVNPFTDANSVGGIADLDGCDLNAAYCCFVQDRQAGDNNGNCKKPYEYECVDKDPADNTNICYVDHARSSKANHIGAGFSVYGDLKTGKENIEGSAHCHGFAWGEDELNIDNIFKGNLLFYVSMYDHLTQRGYARNVPGSPMCACAENMAVVTRADCSQVDSTEKVSLKWSVAESALVADIDVRDLNFNACTGLNTNNNLQERVKKLNAEGKVSDAKTNAVGKVLVGSTAGQCNAAIEEFLLTKNISVVA